MKNNKKGGASLTRPMHIRLLAFLMAVVMVISVMIIHNRNGKVEAADPITDETYLGQDGWLEEAHYTVYVPRTDITFTLAPGDALFMYTDGLPEATDTEGKRLELSGMLEAINRHKDEGTNELLRSIRKEVDVFVKGASQYDDLTMLTFRYNAFLNH